MQGRPSALTAVFLATIMLLFASLSAAPVHAQQANVDIDCYFAVYDALTTASCQGFNTTHCDLTLPIPTASGSILGAIHGQPGQTAYIGAQYGGFGASSPIGTCWLFDLNPFGLVYTTSYTFPSTCTTGYGGSCTYIFTIFGYQPAQTFDFSVQVVMSNASVGCAAGAGGVEGDIQPYCTTMASHVHAP